MNYDISHGYKTISIKTKYYIYQVINRIAFVTKIAKSFDLFEMMDHIYVKIKQIQRNLIGESGDGYIRMDGARRTMMWCNCI